MPVRPTEQGFRALNSPPRVQDDGAHEKTQLVRNPCPNHEYRPRTKRMGRVAKFCALCMDQQEMRGRWKNIRKALATVRRSTRRSSAAAKAALVSARTQWEISIIRTASPATATEGLRVVVAVN